jgi:chromosome segregation ATPase
MVVEYGSEGGSSDLSAGAGVPPGPNEAERATYSIGLPGRPAIMLHDVTEREANEVVMNIRLRQVLRKRNEEIERLEAKVEEGEDRRGRLVERVRELEKERDGMRKRMELLIGVIEERGGVIFNLEEDKDELLREVRLLRERVEDLEELVGAYRRVSGGIRQQLEEEEERIRIRVDEGQFVMEDVEAVVDNNGEEDSGDEADSEATTVEYISAEE